MDYNEVKVIRTLLGEALNLHLKASYSANIGVRGLTEKQGTELLDEILFVFHD